MTAAPTVTLPITANPAGLIAAARIIARHLTAMADDLEALRTPARRDGEWTAPCPACNTIAVQPTEAEAAAEITEHVRAEHPHLCPPGGRDGA